MHQVHPPNRRIFPAQLLCHIFDKVEDKVHHICQYLFRKQLCAISFENRYTYRRDRILIFHCTAHYIVHDRMAASTNECIEGAYIGRYRAKEKRFLTNLKVLLSSDLFAWCTWVTAFPSALRMLTAGLTRTRTRWTIHGA